MRPILRWSGLVSTMAAATLCVAVPAQAHATKQYQWQHMSLAQTITAQKSLVVADWKIISTWQSRQAKAIRAGALWKPEPVEIRWHIAHMKWTQRELGESRARLVKLKAARLKAALSAFPPHHALWVCISRFEGGVTSVNPNGHYGMLQTTLNWMKQLRGAASNYSQAEQEWAAERAWAANGYSYSFLAGQWFNYDDADGCYSSA